MFETHCLNLCYPYPLLISLKIELTKIENDMGNLQKANE